MTELALGQAACYKSNGFINAIYPATMQTYTYFKASKEAIVDLLIYLLLAELISSTDL
jgi:hypothetical protein